MLGGVLAVGFGKQSRGAGGCFRAADLLGTKGQPVDEPEFAGIDWWRVRSPVLSGKQ